MKRYMCDGLPDCKGGEDESRVECGKYIICKQMSCLVLYQNFLN
jgi:hypothetical protein